VPDLSKEWLKKSGISDLLVFLPQNNQIENLAVNNEEILQQMNLDVSNLLKQSFSVFWSHVIFEPSVMKFMDSFLRFKTRPYEHTRIENNNENDLIEDSYVAKLYRQLFKRVFALLVRLSSNREGYLFISDAFWANLVVEKQVWDVAKLFDVALLYGNSNRELVTQMIERLFSLVPQLQQELVESSKQIFQSFRNINGLLMKEFKLAEKSNPSPNSTEQIEYLTDMLASLSALQSLYPRSTHLFQPSGEIGENSFLSFLNILYEDLLPLIRTFATGHHMNLLEKSIVSISEVILDHCYFAVPMNMSYKLSSCKVGLFFIYLIICLFLFYFISFYCTLFYFMLRHVRFQVRN
jgi:hypothetical protein